MDTQKHRAWLNVEENMFAFIGWSISPGKLEKRRDHRGVEIGEYIEPVSAELTIADCARHINLDFSCWGENKRKEILEKLDNLCIEVRKFQKAFHKAYDETEALMKDNPRAKVGLL